MVTINVDEKQVFEQFPALLDSYIYKRVFEIIDSLGIECSDYGIVSSVISDENGSTPYATVLLANNIETNPLINKTGYNLAVGNTVKIYGSRNNMANRYIGLLCENTTDIQVNN